MKIRKFEDSNISAILDLFKISFGKEMSFDYWKWRFKENPFDDSIYIDLMWNKEVLAGHYAVSPIQMIIDGEVRQTALSMTTMTHPEYRGKGVFPQLASSLYQRLKDSDYAMVWGFPNNNSHYGFIKNLAWENISIIPFLTYAISDKIIDTHSHLEVHELNGISDEISENIFIDENKRVQINKTKEFIEWRYIKNPSFNYKVAKVGDVVIIYKEIPSFENSSKIEVDILEVGGNLEEDHLRAFMSYCYEQIECLIGFNTWSSIFCGRYKIFERIGYKMSSPLTYLGYRYFDEKVIPSVEQFKNWDISFSYSDVF